ncbi:alpha/beta fold hydrolase [Streptomyces sp. NPDC051315]|uniref:alpha/beta fold hydrolase n=1 Tax=Streptomyces sp. NPDC051315 TaxID=3365650 RepID=UPI00378F8B3D
MTEPTEFLTTPDGIRLACRDDTPAHATAPPVLLLHGLAGHLGEWNDLTARLRSDGHRVVRYDARGHGASTRAPADMTRAAAVRDAVTVMEELSLSPAILLGQSLGGLTALLTAAAHPSLVTSLILVEAGPAGGDPELPVRIAAWLDSWPAPFPSHREATAFLGHEAWADGLDWREDGGHARVDRDTMLAAVTEPATNDYWAQWARVSCPTLVVRGGKGTMPAPEMTEMHARRPAGTRLVVVPDAGHDVHLDQPRALHESVASFLATTSGAHTDTQGHPMTSAPQDEPPEHTRYAEYLQALSQVAPADEVRLVRAVLTDPDRTMARSAVLRHLDHRAADLHRTPAYEPWSAFMIQATADHPFLTTRLHEWTLLRAITLSHPWSPEALTEASNWLQRTLTETPDVPTPALAFLAEHGRTKGVRNEAARRVQRTPDEAPAPTDPSRTGHVPR